MDSLSLNLRAMVSQRLVPKQDGKGPRGGRGIMLNTPLISDLIFRVKSRNQRNHEEPQPGHADV